MINAATETATEATATIDDVMTDGVTHTTTSHSTKSTKDDEDAQPTRSTWMKKNQTKTPSHAGHIASLEQYEKPGCPGGSS